MTCSQLVHGLLIAHGLFMTQKSWLAHKTCAWLVLMAPQELLVPTCSWFVHEFFKMCSWLVNDLSMTWPWLTFDLFSTCDLIMTWSILVNNLLMIFQLFKTCSFFWNERRGGILEDKVPRILAGRLEPSGEVLNKNHALVLWFWDITKNHTLLSQFLKIFGRNLVPQEKISCLREKFPVTGRNVLWQEEIYCLCNTWTYTVKNHA